MSALSDLVPNGIKSGICNFEEFPNATSGKSSATFSKKYLQKTVEPFNIYDFIRLKMLHKTLKNY